MYAIVKTGGKQYKVAPGDIIEVEKLEVEEGKKVALEAICIVDGKNVEADPAKAAKTKVEAVVLEQFKGDKQLVFKFKKRKNYKRTRGHRQNLTKLQIASVGTEKAPAKKAPAKKAEPKAVEVKAETKAASTEKKTTDTKAAAAKSTTKTTAAKSTTKASTTKAAAAKKTEGTAAKKTTTAKTSTAKKTTTTKSTAKPAAKKTADKPAETDK